MTMMARRCTIEGRGIDGRGASRALASGVVTASGEAATILKVEGNFNVTGPLETFANAGGVHLARALLAEFAGNMARLASERAAPVVAEAAAEQPLAPTRLPARPGEGAIAAGHPFRVGRRPPSCAAGRCCGGRFSAGSGKFFSAKEENHERQPGLRHPGAGFRGRGRRHVVHPDGRRQHVLVGGDGRQSGRAPDPCAPRALRLRDGRRLCPRHRQGRRRRGHLRPRLYPDHDRADDGGARQCAARRVFRRFPDRRLLVHAADRPGAAGIGDRARISCRSARSTGRSTACARRFTWPAPSAARWC